MTIDEAIRHCEKVAENYRYERDDAADINDVGTASDCQQCANDHEQLASWLKDLKEAKRLLKLVIQDIYNKCSCKNSSCDICANNRCDCDYDDRFTWRYKDEVFKIIDKEG